MKSRYKDKIEFHRTQWEIATRTNKQKAAAFHMNKMINYEALAKEVNYE